MPLLSVDAQLRVIFGVPRSLTLRAFIEQELPELGASAYREVSRDASAFDIHAARYKNAARRAVAAGFFRYCNAFKGCHLADDLADKETIEEIMSRIAGHVRRELACRLEGIIYLSFHKWAHGGRPANATAKGLLRQVRTLDDDPTEHKREVDWSLDDVIKSEQTQGTCKDVIDSWLKQRRNIQTIGEETKRATEGNLREALRQNAGSIPAQGVQEMYLFEPLEADFSRVQFEGKEVALTKQPAAMVKLLYNNPKKEFSKFTLNKAAKRDIGLRISDILNRFPLWKTVIVSPRRGKYQLNLNKNQQ